MAAHLEVPEVAPAVGYHSETDLPSYNVALWLEPPPPVRRSMTLASGIGFLIQDGFSANGRRQEVLVEQRSHDCILFFPDGSSGHEWRVEGRPRQLSARFAVATMAAGTRSRWICPPATARVIHLHLPHSTRELSEESAEPSPLRNMLFEPDAALSLIGRALVAELESPAPPTVMLLESYAALLTSKLAGTRTTPMRASGGLAPWQVRRVTEYLHEHLAADVSLRELAALAGLSPFHFARAFKQSLGMPPYAYHRMLRIAHAKRLLAETNLPVTEIAAQVGYEAPQTLARLFQREVGKTPGSWRREARR